MSKDVIFDLGHLGLHRICDLYLDSNSIFFFSPKQIDELLKQRDSIHSSFSVNRPATVASGSGTSSSKVPGEELKADSPEDGNSDGKDKSGKKKWFSLNLKGSDKKLG